MSTPKVSVLMPVYNGGRYLCEAVDSILNQTFADFEFVIVDDGSTDNTWNILTAYAAQDPRIVLIQNKVNVGVARSLNRGLAAVRGEFVARMDADDISLPKRLEKQIQYMEQHPEVGVLGTNIVFMDAEGRIMHGGRPKHTRPESPIVVRWSLLWKSTIYHPTVMIRRAVLERTGLTYDPDLEPAEDRDLWIRLCKHTVVARLPEVMVQCRVVPTSISRSRSSEQQAALHAITRRELTGFLGNISSEEGLETLIGVFTGLDNAPKDYIAASGVLFEVYWRFCERPLSEVDRQQIRADVASRLLLISNRASEHSTKTAFFLLWQLRHVSVGQIFTLKTAKRAAKIVFRAIARNLPAYHKAGQKV